MQQFEMVSPTESRQFPLYQQFNVQTPSLHETQQRQLTLLWEQQRICSGQSLQFQQYQYAQAAQNFDSRHHSLVLQPNGLSSSIMQEQQFHAGQQFGLPRQSSHPWQYLRLQSAQQFHERQHHRDGMTLQEQYLQLQALQVE